MTRCLSLVTHLSLARRLSSCNHHPFTIFLLLASLFPFYGIGDSSWQRVGSLCISLMVYGHSSFLCPILPQEKQRELIPSYNIVWVRLPMVIDFAKGLSRLTCKHRQAKRPLIPLAVCVSIRSTGPIACPILQRTARS